MVFKSDKCDVLHQRNEEINIMNVNNCDCENYNSISGYHQNGINSEILLSEEFDELYNEDVMLRNVKVIEQTNEDNKKKRTVSNYVKDGCVFCQNLQKKSSFSLLLNKALYSKYSSSQNYFYSKDINDILEDLRKPHIIRFRDEEMLDETEEYLKRFYQQNEIVVKVISLVEYYKYHRDIPRLFMQTVGHVMSRFHDKHRKIEYQKVKRDLQLETSSNEDSQEDLNNHSESINSCKDRSYSYFLANLSVTLNFHQRIKDRVRYPGIESLNAPQIVGEQCRINAFYMKNVVCLNQQLNEFDITQDNFTGQKLLKNNFTGQKLQIYNFTGQKILKDNFTGQEQLNNNQSSYLFQSYQQTGADKCYYSTDMSLLNLNSILNTQPNHSAQDTRLLLITEELSLNVNSVQTQIYNFIKKRDIPHVDSKINDEYSPVKIKSSQNRDGNSQNDKIIQKTHIFKQNQHLKNNQTLCLQNSSNLLLQYNQMFKKSNLNNPQPIITTNQNEMIITYPLENHLQQPENRQQQQENLQKKPEKHQQQSENRQQKQQNCQQHLENRQQFLQKHQQQLQNRHQQLPSKQQQSPVPQHSTQKQIPKTDDPLQRMLDQLKVKAQLHFVKEKASNSVPKIDKSARLKITEKRACHNNINPIYSSSTNQIMSSNTRILSGHQNSSLINVQHALNKANIQKSSKTQNYLDKSPLYGQKKNTLSQKNKSLFDKFSQKIHVFQKTQDKTHQNNKNSAQLTSQQSKNNHIFKILPPRNSNYNLTSIHIPKQQMLKKHQNSQRIANNDNYTKQQQNTALLLQAQKLTSTRLSTTSNSLLFQSLRQANRNNMNPPTFQSQLNPFPCSSPVIKSSQFQSRAQSPQQQSSPLFLHQHSSQQSITHDDITSNPTSCDITVKKAQQNTGQQQLQKRRLDDKTIKLSQYLPESLNSCTDLNYINRNKKGSSIPILQESKSLNNIFNSKMNSTCSEFIKTQLLKKSQMLNFNKRHSQPVVNVSNSQNSLQSSSQQVESHRQPPSQHNRKSNSTLPQPSNEMLKQSSMSNHIKPNIVTPISTLSVESTKTRHSNKGQHIKHFNNDNNNVQVNRTRSPQMINSQSVLRHSSNNNTNTDQRTLPVHRQRTLDAGRRRRRVVKSK